MRRQVVAATFRWPLLPLEGTAFRGGRFWVLLPVKKSARLRRRPLQRQGTPEGRKFLRTEKRGSRGRRSGIKNKGICRRKWYRRRRAYKERRGKRDWTRQHKHNRPGHGRILGMATRHAANHRRRPRMMVATSHGHVLRGVRVTGAFLRRVPMQRTHRPIAATHARGLQRRSPCRRPQQHYRHQTHTRPQFSSLSVGIVAHSIHFLESQEYSTQHCS